MQKRAVIPEYLAREISAGRTSGNIPACALFLDISGFTKMTEVLATHGKHGAEVLSQTINRVFGSVLRIVYGGRGFVATFAGDALTALFPGGTIPAVVETAAEIAEIFDREYVRSTPFGEFTIEMKIGIADGTVEWGVIGAGDNLAGYFRGSSVERAAEAEHYAEPGDIVLSAGAAPMLSAYRCEVLSASHFRLLRPKRIGADSEGREGRPRLKPTVPGSLTDAELRIQGRFVPKAVLEGDNPGEFRKVAAVFIKFAGSDDRARLAGLVEPILATVRDFSGYFNLLDFGDKGGIVLVVFGAPRTFGNMTERAAGFSAEILRLLDDRVSVGFATGTAFAGFVGGSARATYTVLGPPVNLAARLAMTADSGTALTAGESVGSLANDLQAVGNRKLKGFAAAVTVYRLSIGGGRSSMGRGAHAGRTAVVGKGSGGSKETALYGREDELEAIQEWSLPLGDGASAGLLVVSGEAGAGKTTLAAVAFDGLSKRFAVTWMYADTILRKSLNPFKGFLEWCFRELKMNPPPPNDPGAGDRLRSLFDALSESSGDEEKSVLEEGVPALLPLLGGVPDDPQFVGLDPQARFERGVNALVTLVDVLSRRRPLAIVVEDAHALDADSITVMERLLRISPALPIGIVFLARIVDSPGIEGLLRSGDRPVTRVELKTLTAHAIAEIMAMEIHGPADGGLVDFVIHRVGSNPFYVKELAAYLVRHDFLRRGESGYGLTRSEVPLPEGISSLLLTRLDSLEPDVRTVARVAALLGSEFRLRELEMVLGRELVAQAMGKSDSQSLWATDGNGVCRFRQELVRETIQNTQLEASLIETHGRIADALARYLHDDPSRYVDLAYHSDAARREDDARKYLKLAAGYAAMNFKNDRAIEFYSRFIRKATSIEEKIEAYGSMAEVHNVIGNWEDAENALVYAIGLSSVTRNLRRRVRLMSRLGAVYQRRGSSREAAAVLDLSVMLARRLDEHGLLAEALLEQGRGFLSRGDFDSATKSLDEALGESRLAGDVRQEGRSLYYRGVVFRDQNRYDDALRCYQEATIRFQAAKDDRLLTFPLYDMGIVLQYTGATVESRRRFEEVIQVYERIGYRSGTAAAVLNVGVLEDRKGDFESAQNCFRRSREIADAIGEKLASGYAVFSMGATYYKMHDYRKALYYLKQSYNLFKGLEARGYYGYPLSYLTCVYADTEAVDSAVRACFLHLKNEKEIGTDVENGRAYLGLATALTKNKPASRTAGDLLGRIARYQKLGESTPDAYFLLAISKASANGYVNTLIPTHHQYGHYLMTRKRDQEANVHLEKAYRLAVDSKWERFVAAFERDHRALVATFAKESGNSKAPQPAGRG